MASEAFTPKKEMIDLFARHVSSGKVNYFTQAGINFVAGEREGIYLSDLDGKRDLTRNLGIDLAGKRILLVGAGGAARGVGLPLMRCRPDELYVVNRTAYKARELSALFDCYGGGFDALPGRQFDVVINATAASLAGELPPLPDDIFAHGALAYDMMYGEAARPFLDWALLHGAERVADGLGMLVEQAAESYVVWHGVRPETRSVITTLQRG